MRKININNQVRAKYIMVLEKEDLVSAKRYAKRNYGNVKKVKLQATLFKFL